LRAVARERWRSSSFATLALTAACGQAAAQVSSDAPSAAASSPGIELQSSSTLTPLPTGDAGRKLPITLRANSMRGRPDLETIAEGDAVLRRGDVFIRADLLSYDHVEDLALARGQVRIGQEGNRYSGPELKLKIQRFEGYFINPTYFLARAGAGGTADRIDFIDDQRSVVRNATYSSCPANEAGDRDWLLTSEKVKMDFEANEGIADNAVLRFLGVPILAAPHLSFPLTEERKSGWLPPSFAIDSRAGVQFDIPYYWNIAPNRDATVAPSVSVRRGVGLGTEFRYLEPNYSGQININLLPNDRLLGRDRYSIGAKHDANWADETRLSVQIQHVSDDDYWKDFRRDLYNLTPRLLDSQARLTRPVGDWDTYARVLRWQVLQNTGSFIETPYERMPQIGARTAQSLAHGLEFTFEGEFNNFTNPVDTINKQRQSGMRLHALASISRPWGTPGWSLIPKLSVNAASYSVDLPLADGSREASRLIPTFSVDSAWVLERDTSWFGKNLRQTLEPHLLYVNTPYRKQSDLPNFDAAGRDFNFETIFQDNRFSGVDRVSDSNELTAGVNSRLLDPLTGAELLRVGAVQRYLFRDQQVTTDGKPLTQRVSDLLLLGTTSAVPNWSLGTTLQYSPERGRIEQSTLSAAYSPGPFRTLSSTYRQVADQSEQVEFGWQWPIYGAGLEPSRSAMSAPSPQGGCKGTLYTVGRVNYSTRDSRLVDAIAGFEYDAGCCIGRIVAERLSTAQSEATTRLMIQLELVGLSRIGSNPLDTLQRNVPGYKLLRDASLPASAQPTASSFYD
jgi:LPS-assembly protein